MSNYRLLKIESSSRLSGSPTDFKITLPRALQKGSEYKLMYAHIPQSYFNVDSTNNIFSIDYQNTDALIEVPVGYYTASSLATALETALNQEMAPSYTVTVTFDEGTQRITIDSPDITFAVKMEDYRDNPFGFESNTAKTYSHSGTSIVNLERYQHLCLDINDIVEVEGIGFGSTFCIPADENILSVVSYSPEKHFPQTVTITNDTKVMHVKLKDKHNQIIDLREADWFFILSVVH